MHGLTYVCLLFSSPTQAAAFLGAVPTRQGATAAKKPSLFKRSSVILKPTLIINHSGNDLPEKEQEAVILEASKIVAKELGKPESYVLVSLNKATMCVQ